MNAPLTWHRLRENNDYCGYRDSTGRYTIARHEVDDREYDGGYHLVHWVLSIEGAPFDQYLRLSDAKGAAERLDAARVARA